MPVIPRLRAAPLLALLALAAPLASAGVAEAASPKKPKGQPRISVSKMGKPPATAAEVGDRVTVSVVVRNRGRKAGRTPIKLIVPKEDGATTGRKLAAIEPKRIKRKGKRAFELTFDVPQALAPGPNAPEVSWDLAACARGHGEGSRFRCKTSKRKLRVEIPPLPPNFEPGKRTAGDPLFPQIGNTGYDAKSYALDLSYNPSNNRFRPGTKAAITAVTTQDLGEFSLDFQRLDVTRVTVDGETAPFELVNATPELDGATQPVKLVITPPEGIPNGTEFTVVVHYRGEPVEIIDPDGSSEGWVRACVGVPTPLTCDGAVVVNEPVGAAGWFPNNNVPADKATFRTSITTPDTHSALGIGELAGKQVLSGGEAKWTWVEENPTATYLTTATVGEFDYTEDEITETAVPRTMPAYFAIDSIATPPQQTELEASFGRIESMVNFLGDRFGPYPFDSAGAIADNVPTLGYALEVQTKPVFAYLSRDDNTMLHEYAHQWFGNSVSPATWLEIWFNEGWAEWAAWYWEFEENGGPASAGEVADSEYAAATEDDWSVPPATLNGDPAELFNFFAGYVRSPMMLQYLREIVGDAKFFGLAEELQEDFAYSTISTDQFIEHAKAASGFTGSQLNLLDAFFQQWLYGNAKPTLLPANF